MKIFGVGIDAVDSDRIKDPTKLAQKILTPAELEKFSKAKNKQNFIAKNFALKEAISKALGTGFGKFIRFSDIEISRNDLGKPEAHVRQDVTNLITKSQNIAIHISLTDSHHNITAFAVVEIL